MKIKPMHPNFKMPKRGTAIAGGYDIFMPEAGSLIPRSYFGEVYPLGFAAEVPEGYVALIFPRSGVGTKSGLTLNNTCGVIDSDYRGEWCATLRIHNNEMLRWEAGDRLLQFLIVPVANVELELADTLSSTDRGIGGHGSTGK